MKILIIGGGNMGLTYAKSFLRAQIVDRDNLMILEKSPQKIAQIKSEDIGHFYNDPASCIPHADLVVLAVKPQDSRELFNNIQNHIDAEQVVLSIMAGITMETIRQSLGTPKIIRAMPNLPAQVGIGMTVFTTSDEVTRIELVMVQNLINTTGSSIFVSDESAIDASTAISGSGPAYVFYFMQSMIDSAREMGFSKSEAELLVSQTFRGTVDLYLHENYNCEEWIQKVASRGGTTEAALNTFNQSKISDSIHDGLQSAFERAMELGKNETE